MIALRNKILIKMDVKQKEKIKFLDTVLHVEKNYNFNLREDNCSIAIVVDGARLPKDALLLVHYLSSEPTYLVEAENILTEEEKKEGYKVFSIPKDNGFVYKVEGGDWEPCENILITSRIFLPYKGILVGIEPKVVKNKMYVVKGVDVYDGETTNLSGKVVCTTPFCDYEIVYVGKDHIEKHMIRTLSREIEAIDESMTAEVNKGKYLVGFTPTDCKKIK